RNPVIDGNKVTFHWRGNEPPRLVGDFNGWIPGSGVTFERTTAGLWDASLELEPDACIEYAFAGDEGGRVLDPLNPRTMPNGLGETNNWFAMPGWRRSPLTQRRSSVPRGVVTRHSTRNPVLLP